MVYNLSVCDSERCTNVVVKFEILIRPKRIRAKKSVYNAFWAGL